MVFAAGFLFVGEVAMSYEQPDYTVIYTDGEIEYRQYEPYLVSETVITNSDDYRDAGNEGFRRLFRYIAGDNQARAKIAMTAPVQQAPSQTRSEKIAMTAPVQQSASEQGWTVSFMLPTEYTAETAPVPVDKRVYIREVPGRLMAVSTFAGRWTERNFAKYESELRDAIAAEGILAVGAVERAAYNAPYTLPFLRRNEVMLAVDRLPHESQSAGREVVRQLAAQ
jgi:hypothetical protein